VTKRSPTARPHADRIPRIAAGPLTPVVLAECSEWLRAQGYSPGSAAGVVNLLRRLSMWMQNVDAGVDDIDEDLLGRFVAAERSRDLVCSTVKSSMGAARRFLTDAGHLTPGESDAGPATAVRAAVAGWCSWMRDERGLSAKTIGANRRFAAGLLDAITPAGGAVDWGLLDAPMVNAYIAEIGRPYGVVTRAHVVDSVRCLLRWALSTGRIVTDLTAGILKPAGSRRSLPRGVCADKVAALLSVCDRATAIGARDRALVVILVRLGLRAGEAASLMLDDIDWSAGHVKVTGKGRQHSLPIPVDVGAALEAWLRVRPAALDRAVFVRIKAPRTMMTPQGISGVIARLSDIAGIERVYAHRLRHTAAMGVLAAGGTLAEAKELLGHAYTVTTMAYAKVDVASLRQLVVPFGRVPR